MVTENEVTDVVATGSEREPESRRSLLISAVLGSAAAAVSAVMAACGGSDNGANANTGASTTTTTTSSGGTTPPPAATDQDAGAAPMGTGPSAAAGHDVEILNQALGAEYTAIKAYDAGVGILDAQHDAIAPVVKAVAQHFQAQHRSHADILAAAIQSLHGTPVTADSVTFSPPAGFPAHPTTTDVIKLAANAEKGAAALYTSKVADLSDPALRFAAAAIGGDESQHFIVLYLLAKGQVTATHAAQANDIVPKAFVASVGNDAPGLESVPDFTYA